MTPRNARTSALVALAVLATPLALLAAGGSSAPAPSLPVSPTMTVADHYNQGLQHRDKAWELEAKAAEMTGSKAEKTLKKAQKEWEKAIKSQQEAIKLEPRAYQSLSSLGYALRKTGRYDESIAAYDKALALKPSYAEAIEYRGEAYLELGRLEDAKSAYMNLFTADRSKADELLAAMHKWLEANAGEGNEDFTAWVEERAKLAEQTAMLSGAEPSW